MKVNVKCEIDIFFPTMTPESCRKRSLNFNMKALWQLPSLNNNNKKKEPCHLFPIHASHAEKKKGRKKSPIYHLNTLHRGPILDTDHDNTSALILLPCLLHIQANDPVWGEFGRAIQRRRERGNDFLTQNQSSTRSNVSFPHSDTRGYLNGRSHIARLHQTAPALEIFCPFVFKGDGLLKSKLSRGRLFNQIARAFIECGGKDKQTVAKKKTTHTLSPQDWGINYFFECGTHILIDHSQSYSHFSSLIFVDSCSVTSAFCLGDAECSILHLLFSGSPCIGSRGTSLRSYHRRFTSINYCLYDTALEAFLFFVFFLVISYAAPYGLETR